MMKMSVTSKKSKLIPAPVALGARDGRSVGVLVGNAEGMTVGLDEGNMLGLKEG